MNDAPIDIIISIVRRHLNEALYVKAKDPNIGTYVDGRIDALEELIQEFEGFKRLFS